MAILSKRIHPSGSGNFISANGNVAATDLVYVHESGEEYQATLSRIEAVIVYNGSATVDGKTFATGNWDLSKYGGIPLTGAPVTSVSISGDCVVVLR